MEKVKKDSKMVSSEGIELKEYLSTCLEISFSWTTPSKLLVSVTHDFIKDL